MPDSFATSDLIDAHMDSLASCETQFRQYGGKRAFHGPISTVKCFEDNVLLRELLSQPGEGRVLVVDGGGSVRRAVTGDMIAKMAMDNGWAGIVIYGAIRDVAELATLDIGIKALGSNPYKSDKAGNGSVDVPVAFGNTTFTPGAWLYSDDDGIVVSEKEL